MIFTGPRDPFALDLDRIVDHLHRDHSTTAYIEQTGGRYATIFAGRQRAYSASCTSTSSTRYAAVAGPGTFSYTGPSRASLAEFYVGPDDDGENPAVDVAEIGCRTDADVARVIAAQAAKTDHQPLSPAEITALGFDASRQSLPASLVVARAEVRAAVADPETGRRLTGAGVPLSARISRGRGPV